MSKKVEWIHAHCLRSGRYTQITKRGEYYGKIKHTYKHRGPQMALVHFEGNKRPSKVPYYELVFLDEK